MTATYARFHAHTDVDACMQAGVECMQDVPQHSTKNAYITRHGVQYCTVLLAGTR